MSGFTVRHTLGAAALVCTIAVLSIGSAAPPPVRGGDTPLGEFSAERAAADIRALTALGPHPSTVTGRDPLPGHEAAHTAARDYAASRMRALGLPVEIQVGESCGQWERCGQVQNLIGRFVPPGVSDGEKAIMLLAHYDSVPGGPGAGDDASGVAAALEITRALLHNGALRRPLLLVIDDGEEAGLLGARVFVRHPWAKTVGVVLNFEARGTSGQTAMFETSERSAWLVEEFARAAPRPVASSVIYTLYKTLPNDTDLTITKEAGLLGLNFAFADEDWHYHTPKDAVAYLDLRSVQHMGDQALAVARRLLERTSLPAADTDAVWFDLFTYHLVVYRAGAARALAAAQVVLFLVAVVLLFRRLRGSAGALLLGALRWLAALAAGVLAAWLVRKGIAVLSGEPRVWLSRPLPTWLAVLSGALASASAVLLALDRLRRKEAGPEQPSDMSRTIGEALGGLLPWTVLSLLITLKVPGASYPFTLPALGASGALLWLSLSLPATPAADGTEPARAELRRTWLLLLVGPLVGAIVWFPLIRILLVMVGAKLPIAIGLPAALLLSLIEPFRSLTPPAVRRLLPIGAAAGALVAMAAARILGGGS